MLVRFRHLRCAGFALKVGKYAISLASNFFLQKPAGVLFGFYQTERFVLHYTSCNCTQKENRRFKRRCKIVAILAGSRYNDPVQGNHQPGTGGGPVPTSQTRWDFCFTGLWTAECRRAFEDMKLVLSSSQVLVHYDLYLPISSSWWLSLWRGCCNFTTNEKEALVLLFGRSFTSFTYHKPLTTILAADKAIPSLVVAQLQRWAILLSDY